MRPDLSIITGIIRRRMFELDIRSYKALEVKAGVARDTVRNLLSGRTKSIRNNKLQPIAEALEISVSELVGSEQLAKMPDMTEFTFIPKYDIHFEGEMEGFSDFQKIIGHTPFNRQWLEKTVSRNTNNLGVINIASDVMEPTLHSEDEILIDLADTSLSDGGIFALFLNGAVTLKRIFLSPDGMTIKSDNPTYPTWNIEKEKMADINVIGRVLVRVGAVR